MAVVWLGAPIHAQVITLEDELSTTPPPEAIVPPSPPETPEPRSTFDMELIPPRGLPPPPAPEEPFGTEVAPSLDIVSESEDAMIFGPEPGDPQYYLSPEPDSLAAPSTSPVQTVGELSGHGSSPEPKYSFGEWLGHLLSKGSSGDPDSRDRLRFTLALSGGYDSNVLASPVDEIGSFFSSLTGGVAYFIGSPRFEVSLRASGGATYYDNRPGGQLDYNGRLSLKGFYRFTRRLTFNGSAEIAYLSQPDPEVIGGISSFQGDYAITNVSLDLSYSLSPLLLVRPAYRFYSIEYQDELVNQASGFISHTFSFTTEYLFRPTTTLTAEYRYNPVTYNIQKEGSEGHILTAGFIQAFSPRFNWTLSGGAEYRLIQNPSEEDTTTYLGPFVESSLNYQFAPASRISWRLRYGTEPSGQGGVTIRRTLRTSLGLVHAFTGNLSVDVGGVYENSFFDQPGVIVDYTQETYSAYITGRFRMTRSLSLNLGYSFTALYYTDQGFGDYTRGVTTLGIELTF